MHLHTPTQQQQQQQHHVEALFGKNLMHVMCLSANNAPNFIIFFPCFKILVQNNIIATRATFIIFRFFFYYRLIAFFSTIRYRLYQLDRVYVMASWLAGGILFYFMHPHNKNNI
ncbi:hypothetical protein ACJX0J_030099 [Zea mays]